MEKGDNSNADRAVSTVEKSLEKIGKKRQFQLVGGANYVDLGTVRHEDEDTTTMFVCVTRLTWGVCYLNSRTKLHTTLCQTW